MLTLHRVPPRKRAKEETEVHIPFSSYNDRQHCFWSAWHLWDRRYWVRIHTPTSGGKSEGLFTLRFLTKEDLTQLRQGLERCQRDSLDRRLKAAPGDTRFTLPAIVVSRAKVESVTVSHELPIALPTIGWHLEDTGGWIPVQENENPDWKAAWLYDIRYRHIDNSLTEGITIRSLR
jgi:hypothetical protein